MLYGEIIPVCSKLHTKHAHTSTLCAQNVELFNFKPGNTQNNH
jgi:hypothetical protein